MVSKIGYDWLNGQKKDIYLLVGTACRDSEVKMLSGGEKCVCKVSVAAGQKQNTETMFITVNAWNRRAKMLTGCHKADTVLAIGPISQHEYNGKKYSNLDADFVIVAGENSAGAGNFAAVAEMAKSVAPAGGYAPNVSAADWPEMGEGDEELPF